jgi:hypothetical protein
VSTGVRAADVVAVRATPVLSDSKEVGVVPNPTMSTTPAWGLAVKSPWNVTAVVVDDKITTPLLPDMGIEPLASGAGSGAPTAA